MLVPLDALPAPATPLGTIDARIAAIVARNRGIASDHRLRLDGISRWAITSRLRSGAIHEVLPRTYAHVPAEQLDARQRMVAARDSLQHHRSLIAFETAGRVLGIWTRGRDRVVHVLSDSNWRPADVPWVRYHWTHDLPWEDRMLVDGILVTDVLRTCLDLGAVLTEWQLTHVLWEAEFRHALDLDELERRNDARRGMRGCRVVRAAIAHRRGGSAGTRSTSEDYLLEAVIRAGLPTPVVCNAAATSLHHIECDLVFVEERLVVEVDGPGHGRAGQQSRDIGRDEELRAAGYVVLRFATEELWADRGAVVATIQAALRRANEFH